MGSDSIDKIMTSKKQSKHKKLLIYKARYHTLSQSINHDTSLQYSAMAKAFTVSNDK